MNKYSFFPGGVRDNKKLIIGSSDIPIIIKTAGCNLKKSQRDLWLEKTGQVEGFKGNELTYWGNELEPLVLARFIKDQLGQKAAYQFKIDMILHEDFRDPALYKPPTNFLPYTEAVHPKFPWAVAHADALFFDIGERPYLVEAKTGRFFSRIKRENMEGFDVSGDGTIEDYHKIPSSVMLQVQWQMLCYGIDLTYVILLVDDNQFFRYEIPAFVKWWPIMIEKASRFYNYCINKEVPPPEKKEDVFGMFNDLKDKAVYVTGDRALIIEEMKIEKKRFGKLIKKYKKKVDDINDAAVLLMQDNRFLFNGESGEKVFSQSKYEQYDLISEKSLDPEDKIKYEERGVLKKSERRKVN